MNQNNISKNNAPKNNIDTALNFGTVEAYKAIRTNLNFAVPQKGCKKIMVCSALNGEGKTTTSVNIAITIAQTGASTIILDCDLRKSRVHRMFGQINQAGISNVLSGMCQLDEAIRDTSKANLKMITAGTLPPNPAELLASHAMEELLTELEKRFEYIILDTPPINLVSDALPVSKLCDGVTLVVKHKSSTHPATVDALKNLKFAGANVVGFVLNGVESGETYKASKYKYKYKYRYRYYKYSYTKDYGDTYGEQTAKPDNNGIV